MLRMRARRSTASGSDDSGVLRKSSRSAWERPMSRSILSSSVLRSSTVVRFLRVATSMAASLPRNVILGACVSVNIVIWKSPGRVSMGSGF